MIGYHGKKLYVPKERSIFIKISRIIQKVITTHTYRITARNER